MLKFSTARESLGRMDLRIQEEADPKHRGWLETCRKHWWGEVINDVDMVMSTMSHGPISYSIDGYPFMAQTSGAAEVTSYDDARRMYEHASNLGTRMAGPVDNERTTFYNEGIIKSGTYSLIFPGILLADHSEPVNPDSVYLVRWPSIVTIPFDEDGLMRGEHILNGAPLLMREISRDQVDVLVDGPLPTR